MMTQFQFQLNISVQTLAEDWCAGCPSPQHALGNGMPQEKVTGKSLNAVYWVVSGKHLCCSKNVFATIKNVFGDVRAVFLAKNASKGGGHFFLLSRRN
jgi:hypothetical protein